MGVAPNFTGWAGNGTHMGMAVPCSGKVAWFDKAVVSMVHTRRLNK
jgi:hypothetical protein